MSIELPYPLEWFQTTWQDFCDHPCQDQSPVDPGSGQPTVCEVPSVGEVTAIEAFDATMESGRWPGVYAIAEGQRPFRQRPVGRRAEDEGDDRPC